MNIFKYKFLKLNKKKSGFTILEIMIVLFMVGVMISGLIPIFLNVITANKSAEYYSTAYRLADSEVEELRAMTFDAIDAEEGTFSANEKPELSALPDGSTIVIDVNEEVNGSTQTDIRQITVTINWNFKSAKTHSISTLITEGGIGR